MARLIEKEVTRTIIICSYCEEESISIECRRVGITYKGCCKCGEPLENE